MMQKRTLALATMRGSVWTSISRYSGKFLVFISTAILARLLSQEDFGVAGYALIVIGFLDVLSDVGVGSALIYERDNPDAAHTAFWLNIMTSLLLFGLIWLLAPLAGSYFNDARAVPLTRALALIFPLTALSNTHMALLSKGLAFSKKFVPDLSQTASKGLISIGFALLGFGAWSLVLGQVGSRVIGTLAYWWVSPWRPRFHFDFRIARTLLSFGSNLLTITAMGGILLMIDYLFVGRYLGAAALGVYTLAFRVPELGIKEFYSNLTKVMFPVFTKARDDTVVLHKAFLMTTRYVTMMTVPLGAGLALVADPFVIVIFGEKWRAAVPVMQAISIYTTILSLTFNAGDLYKAQGKLHILQWMALLRAAILIPALWWAVTVPASVVAVGWTQAAVALITAPLQLIVASHMFNLPARAILQAYRPACIGGACMAAVVYGVLVLVQPFPPLVQLIGSVLSGAGAYVGALWYWQKDDVMQIRTILRSAMTRH
ncbi:MAG: hypothetical protein ETSY1_31020 [Candidatus Entotheonella factor]|uniref:Polysaccharide biosynthesis protein C-terminal domain-containing protein n=1 Tax=Entotheonella factor TaxID=1429438 RepID=W4LBA6_ENTF1|nr:lipopolysaccharide biosynthesis protein [Candidatus Entotheonella palauensis]ETW95348.1 MAG: hypothetical protein ETSY1_31020 [Candidatus Entotheonella factor]